MKIIIHKYISKNSGKNLEYKLRYGTLFYMVTKMQESKKRVISELRKHYSILEIERFLTLSLLIKKKLNYKNSDIILKFLGPERLKEFPEEIEITSLHDLVSYMELFIPEEDKSINGAFFTPEYITDFILNEVKPTITEKILDPSCGSGAFLLKSLEYLKNTNPLVQVKTIVRNNIFGIDILDYNINRTKLILSIYALSYNEILLEKDFNIIQGNSLLIKWDKKFNCIVGNPPYVKFQDLSDNTRCELQKNWDSTKVGTYNLYFAFFELGYSILSKNGRLGFITPNNYFTSLSGEALRKFFMDKKCISKVYDFSSTRIFDAQTYTAITFVNKENNKVISYDKISSGQSPKNFLLTHKLSNNNYSTLNYKKWRLLKSEDQDNIKNIENIGISLESLFDISVGIATLKDEIFYVEDFGDERFYRKILQNGKKYLIEKNITKKVCKISELRTDKDIVRNRRRIICPYNTTTGDLMNEDVLKNKFPLCYNYLETRKLELQKRDKGKNMEKPFYAWGRTQGIKKKGIKILTPTFSSKPRFIIDRDPNSFFTNGYAIFYKNQQNLGFESNLVTLPENSDVLLKIFNSDIMDYYVRKTSVSIEGDYPCYQKNFIAKFTIPYLSESDIIFLRNGDVNAIREKLMDIYNVKL